MIGNGDNLFLPHSFQQMMTRNSVQIVAGFMQGTYCALILRWASVTVVQYLAVNRPFHYALKLTPRKMLCIIFIIDFVSVVYTFAMIEIPVIYHGCFFFRACMGLQVGINLPFTVAILLIQNFCYWKIFFSLRKRQIFRKHQIFRNQLTIPSPVTNTYEKTLMQKHISVDHREFLNNLGCNIVVVTLSVIPILAIWATYIEILLKMPEQDYSDYSEEDSNCDQLITKMQHIYSSNSKQQVRKLMILVPFTYLRTILAPIFAMYRNTKITA